MIVVFVKTNSHSKFLCTVCRTYKHKNINNNDKIKNTVYYTLGFYFVIIIVVIYFTYLGILYFIGSVFKRAEKYNKKVGTKHYTYEGKFSVFWHKNTVKKIQQKNKLNFHKCNGSNAFPVWYHISSINWQIK